MIENYMDIFLTKVKQNYGKLKSEKILFSVLPINFFFYLVLLLILLNQLVGLGVLGP